VWLCTGKSGWSGTDAAGNTDAVSNTDAGKDTGIYSAKRAKGNRHTDECTVAGERSCNYRNRRRVAGIGGMLIGVPIAAAAYRILQAELRGKTPLSSKQ